MASIVSSRWIDIDALRTVATGVGERPIESSTRSQQHPEADTRRLAAEGDLQFWLGRVLERLASTTRCTQVAAWGESPDGEPCVLAARMEGACLAVPSSGSFETARALPGALDLGDAGTPPELTPLLEQGFSAVAPIRPKQTEAPAAGVLLLGGSSVPAGRVRPRTLANLAAAAEQLHAPIQAAAAAERLARLDQEVQQLNRLAVLGRLVAEIVHEIRNPLVSVKTFLQLLPEHEKDSGFADGFLEVAREEIQRIERLLTTLLQHGRPPREESGGDLAEALGSVIQLARLRADDREITLVAGRDGR